MTGERQSTVDAGDGSERDGVLAPDAVLVGIDDTDTIDSELGTGRISRRLGPHLADGDPDLSFRGSVRQGFLVDPRVPYTTHNSAACLVCGWPTEADLDPIIERAGRFLEDISADGSDPGLAIGRVASVPGAVSEFGRRAQQEVVEEREAYERAEAAGIFLDEYGGTGEGVIGALGAVGLTATGETGRFIGYSRIREFEGVEPVVAIREDSIRVVTPDGTPVREGSIDTGDWIRPDLRDGGPTLEVERVDANPGSTIDAGGVDFLWRPTNLDD
ncbi:MAG TPA: hypothetical protein VJ898_10040 [Natrialbaceae archaeon]|nr:hypothetical protein [Natrialbaceae archaeon]